MGFNRRFRFVHDARAFDANLVCECPRCGYRAIFERETLIRILEVLGVNPSLEVAAARLRCSACRHRGCVIELWQRPEPRALELRDGDSCPPKGIRLSISQWCRMIESERKRMRRRARG